MKFFVKCLAIFAWFSLNWGAHAGEPLFLRFEDLPALIHKGNQAVDGTERLKEASKKRTGYLGRSFSPTLELEAGGEIFQTGPHDTELQPYGKAEVHLNLYRGGRDQLEEKTRREQTHLFDATQKRTLMEELSKARNLFWVLVHQRELVSLLMEALDQNEKNLKRALRKIERGLSTPTDRLEFEIHRAQIREEIESLNHGNMLLQIELAALLGMSSDSRFSTSEKIEHLHDEALLTSSLDPSLYPEILFLQTNQRVSELQSKQSKRSWFPEFDLYGGYYAYTLRERDYTQIGLRDDLAGGARLKIPLWDGGQSNSMAQSQHIQSQGFALQTQQKLRSLSAELEVTKEHLRHDHELIHSSEERIVQGAKYLELTLEEYSRGVKNSIDVLGASQRYLDFAKQYAERRKDYQLTKNRLLALLGR